MLKIIISPAKKMQDSRDILEVRRLPAFLDRAEYLLHYLRKMSDQERKELWRCNDSIARLNNERIQYMNLKEGLTPALLSYQGIQYQYMAPNVFAYDQWDYIEEHLYILSGFYGILRPFDGVVPYRLEMQAKVRIPGCKDLYEYWGSSLSEYMLPETSVILNLASKEYSRCIEKYLAGKVRFITCVFGEQKGEKIIEKGTYAKMARGEMVRYMAEHQVEEPEQIQAFDRLGYRFQKEVSAPDRFVFLKA